MAVRPPLAPMLARLVRELPAGDFLYEPKWDGFRCLAFREGDAMDLRSRHDRPFARYFPEVVAALARLPADRFVLDGEILVTGGDRVDFAALMARLHPAASRVERLSTETPASYVAFDLVAVGGEDLSHAPFAERRRRLEELLAAPPSHVQLTPQTADAELASRWLERPSSAGIDGVVAKPADSTYQPGVRAMLKVKLERTADCVVAGFRGTMQPQPAITSLLLGLYGADDRLQHVGVASSLGKARGREMLEELAEIMVPLDGHPWEHGFLVEGGHMGRLKGAAARWTPDMRQDWVPVAPERVCEVAYDQVDGGRLRFPARWRRWRPDRDPRSCRIEQLV